MRKNVLLIIALSFAVGCSAVPETPEVWQCAYDGFPRAFYCVNNKTGEQLKFLASDESFKGAQCLRLEDYQKMTSWVENVRLIAEKKCK